VFATALGAVLVAAVALAEAGRFSSEAAGKVPARPTYFSHVQPILEGRCADCHRIGGIGPFSLRTYPDAFAHRKEMARVVGARIMPPWRAVPGHREYRYDFSLTNDQIATIRRWVAQGAPRGSPAAKGKRLPPVESSRLSRIDARVAMPAAYTPRGVDDYRCFLLPWTPDRTRYVTGFGVSPGRPGQVHHISALVAGPAESKAIEEIDEQAAGPGFNCGGGTAAGAAHPGLQLLGGWAPGGGEGSNLPAGTGIRIEPGAQVLLQVHYHNSHGGLHSKPDRTRVTLRLENVARASSWLAVMDTRWLLSENRFRIPAGKRNVVYSFTGDPRELAPFGTGGVDISKGFLVHAAALHMHYLGTGGEVAIRHGNGLSETLLAIRNWDFRWQSGYFFRQPAAFRPGDALHLECRWDNTAANQPLVNGKRRKVRLVKWGEGTLDEMCVGYLYVTES
jgi:hypothetical protein